MFGISKEDGSTDLIKSAKERYTNRDFVGSYKLLNEALEKGYNSNELYEGLALTCLSLGRFDDAILYSNKLLKLNPRVASGYYVLGRVADKRDSDYNKAADFYTKAIELNPSNTNYYDLRAYAYYKLGRYDQAITDINKTLSLNSNIDAIKIDALIGRAQLYNISGRRDEAIADLRTVLKYDPNNAKAKRGIAELSANTAPSVGTAPTASGVQPAPDAILPTVEIPKQNFSNVAGMGELKLTLKESIIYPFQNPELAKKYGVKPGGGILLYGPPGCGKTFIAKSIAGEAKVNFVEAKISEIRSMWWGQTSKHISTLFDFARKNKPCILFFDEIDALGGSRETAGFNPGYREAVNTFLIEMDGASASNEGLLVLGATNEPWIIDSALKRSGRFGSLVYVPPPDSIARQELFKLCLKSLPVNGDIDYAKLSDLTNYYSAADITSICSSAAKIPWEEAMKTGRSRNISMTDLISSISKQKSTISEWYTNVQKIIAIGGDEYTYDDLIKSIQDYEKTMGATGIASIS
ncbi:MAG: AAA family ATPase [Candidatus Micrarchaeota archaeon]|nr:AAA family ATPase [Candidatus Micrarchaeota archaeon]